MSEKIFKIVNISQVAAESMEGGPCEKLIYQKHEIAYGPTVAGTIRNKVQEIFNSMLQQENDLCTSNNTLLVGKVQSGKTSNLEMLTALACDKGYNLIIIYGGYDTDLLKQTETRFKEAFDIPFNPYDYLNRPELYPVLFTTDTDSDFDISSLRSDIYHDFAERNIPIIITALKNHSALDKVNSLLRRISGNAKAIIIDDEGDQASLNIKDDKENEQSSTYAKICDMKQLLNDPLYFSVTATPQANIFLNDLSQLRPSSIFLLHPSKGYCGAEAFHLSDNNAIYELPSNEIHDDQIKLALIHFLMSSTIAKKLDISEDGDMLIHEDRATASHEYVLGEAKKQMELIAYDLDTIISHGNETLFEQFEKHWEDFFDSSTRTKTPFDTSFIQSMAAIAKDTCFILQNSKGKKTRQEARFRHYKIWVGGDLLQRGLTFKHLTTTLFTRWAKTGGNMDTNLQRARWFGYREKYFPLCKIFTTNEIKSEFAALADIEEDLWMQFAAVESKDSPIEDIYIKAENTKQKPARANAVDTNLIEMSDWKKQGTISLMQSEIASNNCETELLKRELDFKGTSLGSADEKTDRNKIAYTSVSRIERYFKNLEGIFQNLSFDKSAIDHILKSIDQNAKVAVILMSNGDRRERSFMNDPNLDKIIVLQQGRDPNARTYLGDKHVIDSSASITLQIFNIVPKHNNIPEPKLQQYMHAIYSNRKSERRYIRG